MDKIAKGLSVRILHFRIFLLRNSGCLPLLRASILLACLYEGRALGGHLQQIAQPDPLLNFQLISRNRRVLLDRLRNDIMQRQIVMGFDVRHNISRIICGNVRRPGCDIVKNRGDRARSARYEPGLAFRAIAGLQLIAEFIGKYANAVRFVHPCLICAFAGQCRIGGIPSEGFPAFTDEERLRMDGFSGIISRLDGIGGGIAHHVPAHSVDFIFAEPVFDRIHHQLLGHLMAGRQIVAEAADKVPVDILKSVVIRYDIIQKILLRHMGIDDIQNYTHTRLMDRINQALQLLDPLFGISRLLRISAIRREIAMGIISPVVFIVLG
ncbi:hypothetical protein D3C73_744300 [compost metagenome]